MEMLRKLKQQIRPWQKNVGFVVKKDFEKFVPVWNEIESEKLAKVSIITDEDINYHTSANIDYIGVTNNFRFNKAVTYLSRQEAFHNYTTAELQNILKMDLVLYGMVLLANGDVDCLIVDSSIEMKNLISKANQILDYASRYRTVCTCNVVETTNQEFGYDGIFVFSDTVLNPCPTPEVLADIAMYSTATANSIMGISTKTSLLCFSTKGSASHEHVDRVNSAVSQLKLRRVQFCFDGELQLDASIVPFVGKSKAPNSDVAGYANVLVFPDLNAANIGYQLVTIMGDVKSYGPILHGYNKSIQVIDEKQTSEQILFLTLISLFNSTKI